MDLPELATMFPRFSHKIRLSATTSPYFCRVNNHVFCQHYIHNKQKYTREDEAIIKQLKVNEGYYQLGLQELLKMSHQTLKIGEKTRITDLCCDKRKVIIEIKRASHFHKAFGQILEYGEMKKRLTGQDYELIICLFNCHKLREQDWSIYLEMALKANIAVFPINASLLYPFWKQALYRV